MNSGRTVRIVRWIARVGAGLTAVFILFMLIAHAITDGAAPLQYLTARETAMMAAFGIMWLGLIIGWKWELVGGLLSIGGVVVFYLVDYLFSGTFPRGPIFFILAFPGALFLYCGVMDRSASHKLQVASCK